jgi:hypothetical protein
MSYGLFLYHLNSVTTRQICLPRREMGFIHAWRRIGPIPVDLDRILTQ